MEKSERFNGIANCTSSASRHSLKSIHWLISSQGIAPRGKKTRFAERSLDEQCGEDFPLHPRPARGGLGFGNVPDLEQRFQALEGQFHLPAAAVKFEHAAQRHFRFRQRGEDDDELRVVEGLLPDLCAILLRLSPRFDLGGAGLFGALADRAQSRFEKFAALAALELHLSLRGFAERERAQPVDGLEGLASSVQQGKCAAA